MTRQNELRIGRDRADRFFQRGETVHEMPCRHQNGLFVEQVFDLGPIDAQALIGRDHDILLEPEVGRTQPQRAETAAGRDRPVHPVEDRDDIAALGQHRVTAPKLRHGPVAPGGRQRRFGVQCRGRADGFDPCLLYTSPSPRDRQKSRMPSSA